MYEPIHVDDIKDGDSILYNFGDAIGKREFEHRIGWNWDQIKGVVFLRTVPIY